MRVFLPLLALVVLAPLASAGGAIPPLACSSATSSCHGLVCVLPTSGDAVCLTSGIGVCIENHWPCEWDQLACVYDASGTLLCIPDIS